MSVPPRALQVLEDWLGPEAGRERIAPAVAKRWFEKSEATDRHVREAFGTDVAAAASGALDAWSATPRGRLALIVLLDQLTRNIHRDSGEAFRHDTRALALAKEGLALGHDRALASGERQFFYMPFMHSEVLADQEQSCALFEALAAEAPHVDVRRWARAHRDIVARFGRFPHRNALLGRASTPEELDFLRQPGSSF